MIGFVSVLEAAIIYLSAGAPFGVLVYFSSRNSSAARTLYLTVLAILFWPVFAAVRLNRSFHPAFDRSQLSDSGVDLEALRRLVPDLTSGRDLADTLERYIRVSEDPMQTHRSVQGVELLRIAGHSDPELGARCLMRERSRRLADHREGSARSLLGVLRQSRPPKELLIQVAEICSSLGDRDTANSVRKMAEPSISAEISYADASAESPVLL